MAISLGEMPVASLESDCRGSPCFLILSPGPNLSAGRPDYLFKTVIGIWEVIPLDCVKLTTYRTDHR